MKSTKLFKKINIPAVLGSNLFLLLVIIRLEHENTPSIEAELATAAKIYFATSLKAGNIDLCFAKNKSGSFVVVSVTLPSNGMFSN